MSRSMTIIWTRTETDRGAADHRGGRQLAVGVRSTVFLLLAALICACQTELPPLPYPPGPYTSVRLSPGDTIKVAFAENSDLDITEKIRRDGKVSLQIIGEVHAAGKRVIDFQHQLTNLYDEHLDNSEVLITLENGNATAIVSGFAN